jgi:SulP family sulfate permease
MAHSIVEKIKKNWRSGITVSLVSIPLSVSLAVASQSTPVIGIITAIWAGLIASIFGGSDFNVVGPTGALSGLLATYALAHGQLSLSMLAIVAGVFILIAYLGKLERYLVFVPASTVHGFTLGVAFIIAFGQFNFATGLKGLPAHEKFIDNLFESLRNISHLSGETFGVFVLFLLALYLLAKYFPRLPGAIVLAPVGIGLGYLSSHRMIPLALQTLGDKFPDLSARLFLPPHFFFDTSLLSAGATVALVAILETMISARIADSMTKTKHHKRKELLALGLANIASGVMGGIPATAALARTSLNIKTGATNKISSTISSVSVALIALVLLSYFRFIPLAVIAAILVNVAVRMVEREHFSRMYAFDKKNFALSLVVAGVTIYIDPIIGILFGVAASLLLFIDKISRGQFELTVNNAEKQIHQRLSGEKLAELSGVVDTLVYSLKGQLAYINGQAHLARFEESLKDYRAVILRMRELYFIDLDGVEIFDEIVELILNKGKTVYVTGVNSFILEHLKESKHFRRLREEGHIVDRTSQALNLLGYAIPSTIPASVEKN